MTRDVRKVVEVRPALLLSSGLVRTVEERMGAKRGYANEGTFGAKSTPRTCVRYTTSWVLAVVECYIDS